MSDVLDALFAHANANGAHIACREPKEALTRAQLLARVAGFASTLTPLPKTIGLFGQNGIDWAVAQLACMATGKRIVPLPMFFSAQQLGHIIADAQVEHIVATSAAMPQAMHLSVPCIMIGGVCAPTLPAFVAGGGQIIYTSGSTGTPKGVRLESGQLDWSATALSRATQARETDVYLSLLPLPLLLETICAILVPVLAGAQVYFDLESANEAGAGRVPKLAEKFGVVAPTSSMLVPQLLAAYVGELAATGAKAPKNLRFVAVGGAPVPTSLAKAAWAAGVPVFEGYGLSECSSVVALNVPQARREGSVGRVLPDLTVEIEADEIIVTGPSIMDGYLGSPERVRRWPTGDLGALDVDGYLYVHGRKDNLLVTAFGRNVSPEWIETLLQGDPRIGLCAVFGHGEPHLHVLIIPSRAGTAFFDDATPDQIDALVRKASATAPDYAIPATAHVLTLSEAAGLGLLTPNGRFRRKNVASHFTPSKL